MPIDIDEKPYTEFLGGRAVRKVSPKRRHGVVQSTLATLLRRLSRDYGIVATEWRFRIDERPASRTHLVPDVAFVTYERWRPLSEAQREEPPFAPDVAIEVRSPSDRKANVAWKMDAYLRYGGTIALDVTIERRTIVAYANDGRQEYALGDIVTCRALPWLRFKVDEAFEDLEPGE